METKLQSLKEKAKWPPQPSGVWSMKKSRISYLDLTQGGKGRGSYSNMALVLHVAMGSRQASAQGQEGGGYGVRAKCV